MDIVVRVAVALALLELATLLPGSIAFQALGALLMLLLIAVIALIVEIMLVEPLMVVTRIGKTARMIAILLVMMMTWTAMAALFMGE